MSDTSGQAIANLGYQIVTFERPMFPGDSLYAESEVLEKRESSSKPDRGILAIETRASIRTESLSLSSAAATWLLRRA